MTQTNDGLALAALDAPTAEPPSDAGEARRMSEALRAVIAGGAAARLIQASAVVFEAGGKLLLDEGAKKLVRDVAEKGASKAVAIAAGPLMPGVELLRRVRPQAFAGPSLARSAASGARVGRMAARLAGREILKGAGKAAGIGLAIDGAIAGVEAVVAVRNGTMDQRSAVRHVAKEAATGAIATGTGVLLGAGLVALTGGIAAPVVFAVGAVGSVGTKRLLTRWLGRSEAATETSSSDPT